MSADPPRNQRFDTSILNQLACPLCMGELRLAQEQLVCGACGRGYPVVDGIPVLIAAQAIALGYTLVTDNESEFARIDGLARENWLRQK